MKSFFSLLAVALCIGLALGGSLGYQYGQRTAWPVADAMAAQTKADQEWLEARFSNTGKLAEMCRDFVLEVQGLIELPAD